uniref:Uncharacterized protein n=1 Tax=Tomato big bud phytoplasma TaxID=35770 RepID=Q1WLZ7_TOBBP|nr:unknown [Tomato big bud phytoplasma]
MEPHGATLFLTNIHFTTIKSYVSFTFFGSITYILALSWLHFGSMKIFFGSTLAPIWLQVAPQKNIYIYTFKSLFLHIGSWLHAIPCTDILKNLIKKKKFFFKKSSFLSHKIYIFCTFFLAP